MPCWEPIRARFAGRRKGSAQVTSLIEEFQYPKFGPGMMWETCTDRVTAEGTEVLMETRVERIEHRDGRATTVHARTKDGTALEFSADHVVSSMPFPQLLRAMDPRPPAPVLEAADDLGFRDFLTVALVVPEAAGFPDNWIYIHSPDVKVGRIQNFGSWSPYLVKDGNTCLGLEYFVFEGDELWDSTDEELIARGTARARHPQPGRPRRRSRRVTSCASPRPTRSTTTSTPTGSSVLNDWIASTTPNVHPVGRNGMHKYNNQDHSMLTAMLTVENILRQGRPRHLDGQRRRGLPRGVGWLRVERHRSRGPAAAPRHRPIRLTPGLSRRPHAPGAAGRSPLPAGQAGRVATSNGTRPASIRSSSSSISALRLNVAMRSRSLRGAGSCSRSLRSAVLRSSSSSASGW